MIRGIRADDEMSRPVLPPNSVGMMDLSASVASTTTSREGQRSA
jgi:hypothetical protein